MASCERWREMLSAQLDGEDDPADRPLVDEHLAGCAGCREWLDGEATVNRLTRMGVGVAPDLSASILAAAESASILAAAERTPSKRRFPLAAALYIALAGVGAVQLILGLDQIGGGVAGAHVHTGMDATPGHLWHESAAWNVAVGAGYMFIALRRVRPSGLVPMLTAFVGMLLLLSVNDLTGDRVDSTRLVSHGFVILGYLLVVALTRIPGGFAAPPGARATTWSGWRARFADEDEPASPSDLDGLKRPGLRLVPPGPMTAEHRQDRPAAQHRQDRPAAQHRQDRPAAEHRQGRPAVEHRQGRPAAEHRQGRPAA
jgi:predicted anti-sigma-YlaC factor YlaD